MLPKLAAMLQPLLRHIAVQVLTRVLLEEGAQPGERDVHLVRHGGNGEIRIRVVGIYILQGIPVQGGGIAALLGQQQVQDIEIELLQIVGLGGRIGEGVPSL